MNREIIKNASTFGIQFPPEGLFSLVGMFRLCGLIRTARRPWSFGYQERVCPSQLRVSFHL